MTQDQDFIIKQRCIGANIALDYIRQRWQIKDKSAKRSRYQSALDDLNKVQTLFNLRIGQ